VRATLGSLISLGLLIAAFVYYGNRLPHFKQHSAEQSPEAELDSDSKDVDSKSIDTKQLDPEELIKNPRKAMAVDGPLARWMKDANPGGKLDDNSDDATEHRPPWKAHANDHIAPSPAGTSGVVLHKTFSVARGISFPFTIPPHAATPQLRGTFQSSLPIGGNNSDESPDIAFLLLNQQQYDGFLHGHLGDSLIAVDSSHNQDVNFGLPSSLNQPVTYYLVFRNNPRYPKKTVQADFKIDF
jgi:hypothetical protein